MSAGQLRHRIVLQSPNRSTNDDGQRIASTWSTVATVWANVLIAAAGDDVEHRQKRGVWTATVRVRWSPTTAQIRQDWRFTFEGRTYHVNGAADNDGLREWIEIDAESRPGLS